MNYLSFFTLLLHIDRELALAHQSKGCACGGVLHSGRQRRRQAQAKACRELQISERTLARWRHWWQHLFVQTPLWHTVRAHLIPPIDAGQLPVALLDRFPGNRQQKSLRLLFVLSPLS